MWQSNADLSKKLNKCTSYVDYRLRKDLSYEEIIRGDISSNNANKRIDDIGSVAEV